RRCVSSLCFSFPVAAPSGISPLSLHDALPISTGIALIYKDGRGKPKLRYVYDIADTRPVRGAKMPYLWEVTQAKHDAIREALERSEEHTSELQSRFDLVCRLLLEKKK